MNRDGHSLMSLHLLHVPKAAVEKTHFIEYRGASIEKSNDLDAHHFNICDS